MQRSLRRMARSTAGVATLLALVAHPVSLGAQTPEARAIEHFEKVWRSVETPSGQTLTPPPGVSIAVAVDGRIVLSAGRGTADLDNLVPATSSTVYNIGSVSKVLTAVAIMQLVERGQVRLEDRIQSFLPLVSDQWEPVTIWNLLTHTGGIRHYRQADFRDGVRGEIVRSFDTFEDAISLFREDPLLYSPGEFYHYTSYGVNLLQGIIERVSGLPFEEYMRRHVWGPAGMLQTSFDVPSRIVPGRAKSYVPDEHGELVNYTYADVTYKFASGGMLSTVEDLVRFAVALNEGRLLDPDLVREMFRPQLDGTLLWQRDGEPTLPTWEQGLMWRLRKDSNHIDTDDAERRFIHHCGTVKGFNACLVNYPDERIVVAVAQNGWDGGFGFVPLVQIADFFRTGRKRR